ncbi:Hypothetical protein AA314_07826 [Archangium gephyra]|uniref:Uncharacterized protein n=1 Tax=Archangium gephyra TaxID=48 RepID=A0AAC8QFI9_9BACT|nr:Hypothetical protein AA314_07826 [Archangium gephyra]
MNSEAVLLGRMVRLTQHLSGSTYLVEAPSPDPLRHDC